VSDTYFLGLILFMISILLFVLDLEIDEKTRRAAPNSPQRI